MLVITCPRLRSDTFSSILWIYERDPFTWEGGNLCLVPVPIFDLFELWPPRTPQKEGQEVKRRANYLALFLPLFLLFSCIFIRRPLVFLLAKPGPNVYFFLFACFFACQFCGMCRYLNGPEWPDRSGWSVMIVLLDFYSCDTTQSLGDLFCGKPLLDRTGVTRPEWPECDDCTF